MAKKQTIKNKDLKPYDIRTFFDKVKQRKEIDHYVVVYNNEANCFRAPEGGVIIPFVEDLGDTFQHWIIILDKDNNELARQNAAHVSFYFWKK